MNVPIPKTLSANFVKLLEHGFKQIKDENDEAEQDPRHLPGVLEDSLGLESYELLSDFGEFLQAEGLRGARLPLSSSEIANAWELFVAARPTIRLPRGLNPAMMIC